MEPNIKEEQGFGNSSNISIDQAPVVSGHKSKKIFWISIVIVLVLIGLSAGVYYFFKINKNKDMSELSNRKYAVDYSFSHVKYSLFLNGEPVPGKQDEEVLVSSFGGSPLDSAWLKNGLNTVRIELFPVSGEEVFTDKSECNFKLFVAEEGGVSVTGDNSNNKYLLNINSGDIRNLDKKILEASFDFSANLN